MPGAPNRYVIIESGSIQQRLANETSAGPSDGGKLVALNPSGQIDASMLTAYTIGGVSSLNAITGAIIISGGTGVQVSVTGASGNIILISVSGAVQSVVGTGWKGSPPATGLQFMVQLPFNCLLTGWSIMASVSGSCAWDIWYVSGSGAPPTAPNIPTSANKISASAGPSVTSASAAAGGAAAIATWTQLVLLRYGTIAFNLASVSGFNGVLTLELFGLKF